jgi:hypothetical protein
MAAWKTVSDMTVCSTTIRYASSAAGITATAASHPGAPRRTSSAYSVTAMPTPTTCWSAIRPAALPRCQNGATTSE